MGKSARKILQENPPKFAQQQSPTHFCRGAGPTIAVCDVGALSLPAQSHLWPDLLKSAGKLLEILHESSG